MPPSRIGADVTTNATTLAQKSAPSRAAKPARGSSASSVASTTSSRLTAVRRTRSTVVMRVDYAPESRSLDRAHESIRSRFGHRRESRRAAPKVPFARYFAGAQRAPAVVDSVIHWSTRFHGVDSQPDLWCARVCRYRRLDELWREHGVELPAHGRLRGESSKWRQACEPPGGATDAFRIRCQSGRGKDTWRHNSQQMLLRADDVVR